MQVLRQQTFLSVVQVNSLVYFKVSCFSSFIDRGSTMWYKTASYICMFNVPGFLLLWALDVLCNAK